jgi:hypothetical protein
MGNDVSHGSKSKASAGINRLHGLKYGHRQAAEWYGLPQTEYLMQEIDKKIEADVEYSYLV